MKYTGVKGSKIISNKEGNSGGANPGGGGDPTFLQAYFIYGLSCDFMKIRQSVSSWRRQCSNSGLVREPYL